MDKSKTKEKLDQISPTMCVAKWKQTTIHLHDGTTHSCHHPPVHGINLDSLSEPSNLHNTPEKIEARKLMLKGERPPECQYCWNIEDNTTQYSDRVIKSSYNWAYPDIEDCSKTLTTNPNYVELSFDKTCNLKCAYCSPIVSSKWEAEIEKHGPYPTRDSFNTLDRVPKSQDRYNNPYVDAFWKWYPDLKHDLKVLRVTGGEPLLSKELWNLLDKITPVDKFEIGINSNLSVPDKLINRLIKKINSKYQTITIFTSAEAYGKQCEYIRYGMDFEKFQTNVVRLLEETNAKVMVMQTINILSCTTIDLLLKWINELKEKYGKDRIASSLSYIRYPKFLDMRLLSDNDLDRLSYSLYSVPQENWQEAEKIQVKRLQQYFMNNRIDDVEKKLLTDDFKSYITEYDKRRGTSFLTIFPELGYLIGNN